MRKTTQSQAYFKDSSITMQQQDEAGHETPKIKGLRVLVVDDDGDTAFILARMLIHEGAQVKWAASVAEALEWMKSFQPHLILSDLSMPEEDGFDLIRKLRTSEASQGAAFIPAIAVSAYSTPAAMQRSFEEGYQAFFPKPVKSQYLIEAVARLALVQKALFPAQVSSLGQVAAAPVLKRVF